MNDDADNQSWYRSSAWQAAEREAARQLDSGDYIEYETMDQFIRSLDSSEPIAGTQKAATFDEVDNAQRS